MSETQPEQQALASAQATIADLQDGKLPSNKDITQGISEVQAAANESKSDLSAQGQKVLEDTNRLLETVKRLVEEKNSNEELQTAYKEVLEATDKQDIAARRQKIKQIVLSAVNSDATKDEAAKGVDSLMTIVRLLISSPEFRSLINDLETIFEQVFVLDPSKPGDAGQQIAEKVPGDVQVSVDSNPITGATQGSIQAASSNTAFGANVSANWGTTYRFGQQPLTTTADPFHLTEPTAEGYFGNHGASLNLGGVTLGDANTPLSQDQAADEVEDTLVEHYAKIAKTLNNHPEYRNSLNYLIQSLSQLSSYLQQKAQALEAVHEREASKLQNQEANAHAREAWLNGKAFLEHWVGPDYSLDEFLESVNDIATRAKEDEELSEYLKEVRDFFEKSAADRDYVQDEERVKADARKRIQKGRRLANENKYQKEFERLKLEFQHLNDGIQSDEGVQQLQSDFKQLVGDLFLDSNGNATLHTDLLRDLQIVIPSIIKKLRRLPLPEIDMSDDTMDLKIKNAVLDCADIAPSHFQFTLRADTEGTRVNNIVQVIISKIRARVLGADFYINKKTFPRITESGKADLAIYGKNGMTIAFEICPWDVENNDASAPALKLKRNVCKISKLDLRLRKTQHDILYGMLSPIISSMVRTKIEEGIRDNIKTFIEEGSIQAKQSLQQGVDTAKAAAKNVDTSALEAKVEQVLN